MAALEGQETGRQGPGDRGIGAVQGLRLLWKPVLHVLAECTQSAAPRHAPCRHAWPYLERKTGQLQRIQNASRSSRSPCTAPIPRSTRTCGASPVLPGPAMQSLVSTYMDQSPQHVHADAGTVAEPDAHMFSVFHSLGSRPRRAIPGSILRLPTTRSRRKVSSSLVDIGEFPFTFIFVLPLPSPLPPRKGLKPRSFSPFSWGEKQPCLGQVF